MDEMNCLIISDGIDFKKILSSKDQLSKQIDIDISRWNVISTSRGFYEDKNGFYDKNLLDYDLIFFDIPNTITFIQNHFKNMRNLSDPNIEQTFIIFATSCEVFIGKGRKKIINIESNWKSRTIIDLMHKFWNILPKSFNDIGRSYTLEDYRHNILRLFYKKFDYKYIWKWSIKPDLLPKNSISFAKNKKGDIISLMWCDNKKKIIILPHPHNKENFIVDCITNIDDINYTVSNEIKLLRKPEWILNYEYDPFGKQSLKSKKDELEKQIDKIELYDILLYGTGKPLENAINKIFSILGFKDMVQSQDRVDLKFSSINMRFIVEIKGLKSIAKERNISQMYRWLAEDVKERNNSNDKKKPTKQLFVCNALRELNPKDRGNFFHKKVVQIASTHKWGLLSTLDLYNILLEIDNKNISKEKVISDIESQVGIIHFKK